MTDNNRISQLIDIFSELADLSGGLERTSIFPNLEVIDAAPASLPATYIIIQDQEGFYIPALKVPGVTYTNGDLVNVLYIKGTEPIAFQQGSGSGGGGGSGGWPYDHVLTVSSTNADAQYTTITDAITAAGGLGGTNIILLDDENITEAVTLNVANTVIASVAPDGTVIQSGGATTIIITADNCTLLNLIILNSNSGTTANCVKLTGNEAHILSCYIAKSGTATNANGIKIEGGSTHIIRDCYVSVATGTNRYGILADTASSTTRVFGGNIDGTTFSIRTNVASSVIRLLYPILGNNGYQASIGSIVGWHFDVNYNLITVDTSGMSGGVWREATGGLRYKEASLTTAIANASNGDVIRLYPGTYTGAITVNKSISIIGTSPNEVILTQSTNDTATVTITATAVSLINLTIGNTGGGGSGAAIYNDQNGLTITNCILTKAAGAPTNGATVGIGGGTTTLNNTSVSSTSGTSKYGFTLSAGTLTITNGSITGADAAILTNSGVVVDLQGPKILSGIIDTAAGGTVKGWYLDTNDNPWYSIGSNTFIPLPRDYVITPSVTSNDLTVAVKTLGGNDASASEPIGFKVGNTWYVLTAAASFTKNDSTNWMNLGAAVLAAQDTDVFMYAIGETGASAGLKFGISRIAYATTMGDFSGTTTNEKYIAGNWTNKNATDKVALIGRLNVALSATAAFNWSLPTQIVINFPIYETRWLTYTPTVTSQTGTITTPGTCTGQYQVRGRNVAFKHSIAVTTNGTGATGLVATMPMTPSATGTPSVFNGKDILTTGKMVMGQTSGATVVWYYFDFTYPGATGSLLYGNGEFRWDA